MAPLRFVQSPGTFTVEEIPLFPPCGHGSHAYLTVRRAGSSTPFLLGEIRRRLRLAEEDLGCAGMKDRDAVAVQTFSIPSRLRAQAELAFGELGCEVLSSALHTHKLRTGKLAGNRFTVRVEGAEPTDGETLEADLRRIEAEGMPNAFGPQRFADRSGLEEGRKIFLGHRPSGPFRRARFLVSAFQALLFNDWLEARRSRGLLPWPVPGDVMKRHDSGGEFPAEEVDETLLARVRSLEISPAGPLFGGKMARASKEALQFEEETLARHGLTVRDVASARAPGARRPMRVPVGRVEFVWTDGGAVLSFTLPPGSYASVLLGEAGIEIVPPPRREGAA
ncbi:MAG: tRNA pseudouridine(13) synthase TruD [Acidobacteriota bacterium]